MCKYCSTRAVCARVTITRVSLCSISLPIDRKSSLPHRHDPHSCVCAHAPHVLRSGVARLSTTRPVSRSSHRSRFAFKIARSASINLDTFLLDLKNRSYSLFSHWHSAISSLASLKLRRSNLTCALFTCISALGSAGRLGGSGGAHSQVACEGGASPRGSKYVAARTSVRVLARTRTVTCGSHARACYLTCDLYCMYVVINIFTLQATYERHSRRNMRIYCTWASSCLTDCRRQQGFLIV